MGGRDKGGAVEEEGGSRVEDGVNGGVAGRKNEGWDRGNVALIALDPGDLIICPHLPSARGGGFQQFFV